MGPDAVALLETPVDDDAVLVEDEAAGIGNALVARVGVEAVVGRLLGEVLVEESQIPDCGAALVTEQRVGDVVRCGEIAEDVDGVVADGVDGDALALEVGETVLQPNELRAAEGSPVGATVEDDQPLTAIPVFVEIDWVAALIRQFNIRKSLAHLRADLVEIEYWHRRSYVGHRSSFSLFGMNLPVLGSNGEAAMPIPEDREAGPDHTFPAL